MGWLWGLFCRDFDGDLFPCADGSGVESEDVILGLLFGPTFGHGYSDDSTDTLTGLAMDEGESCGAIGYDLQVALADGAAGDTLYSIDQAVLTFHTGKEVIAALGVQLIQRKIGQNEAQRDTAAGVAVEVDAILNGDGMVHEKSSSSC